MATFNKLKNYEINYDLNSYDKFILECFKKSQGLHTILKRLIKKFPVLDEIVILAHIIHIAKKTQFYFTKNQIRYCFNKFHKRELHGDKDSYLKYLYSLRGIPIRVNSATYKTRKAFIPNNKAKVMSGKGKPSKINKTQLNPLKSPAKSQQGQN